MHRFFYPLLGLPQFPAVILVILFGYWTDHLLGRFAWDGSNQQFNLHPLLMILRPVFLHGDAILMFQIFRKENKTVVRRIHIVMQAIVMICVIISLKAVFKYHRTKSIPNIYSAHSWIGLITVLLFPFQKLTMGPVATVGDLGSLVVGFTVTYPPFQRTDQLDVEKLPLTQAGSMGDFQATDDERVVEE